MKTIGSLEQWDAIAVKLSENGYQLWQMQYDTSASQGFHAWFWAPGKPVFEIMTYSDAVYNAVIKYKFTGDIPS